ncbi:MAG: hypothetical protein EP305_00740 [Bacteroidetes bacterium]|nr:MAG: hypothetical protein EP305_00740 [Bacteroidota bacterium]
MAKQILESEKIKEINEANFIVRHFIDLSSKLLPFLAELQLKPTLSEKEQEDKNKIIQVFNSYGFDTCTSLILMQSPILDQIKEAYRKILIGNKEEIQLYLSSFQKEHIRLKNNWKNSVLN